MLKNRFFFISIILILLISCHTTQENKITTKVENAVESIPEKVEDAVESIEEPAESNEISDQSEDIFQPTPFITKILDQLGVQPKQVYEQFVVQKVMPYDETSTVVVIPTVASQEYDWDVFTLNSYILVVDSETAEIKQQFYEKESWYSDAIRIDEISIDTANYNVTDGKRAFGITLFYIGASKPNPYNSTTISLFIQEENALVRVLDAFEINSYWGEWDMRCTGEFTSVGKVLIMDHNQNNGFYDIKVNVETTTMETFEKGEDDCDEKEITQKSKQLLRYYGSYRLYQKVYTLETESSCGLEIKLEGNQYYLKTSKREHTGIFVIKDGYITFQGLLSDDPKKEVQGSYDDDEIVIQNYGNAMNPFTVFGECADQKYLRLVNKE
ncbi:hypothetical protein SAMN04487910_0387 [Aquimarina amphilecti]|uniref:Lipoprotein n=1 Tax=Aquimarina amphilecti TaxID=1038014 RepID=A0A1H7GIM8_AQUAM|nr:hypothetical protein [Aquimarina amphilecti]SEK37941.1 hypothetical protein SAMN04487910_0387 [Aquimarina amphilecti]